MHHPSPPTRLLLIALLTAGCAAKDKSEVESSSSPLSDDARAEATRDQKAGARGGERGSGLGPAGPAVLIGAPASPGKTRAALPDAPQSEDKALLVAIDTPYEIFSSQGSYIHVAAWRTSGAPAANARVYVGADLVGQTDAHGAFVFLYPPPGHAEDEALARHEITVVDAQDARIQGVVPFEPMLRTASFASDQLYAYTDRGVYRPGERVHVRLIGWHLEEDYHALEGAPLEVLLRDPAGATVAGGVATTDADGVAAIDLLVPARGAEGIYSLEVAYKESREQARIQVRAFKPPALQLTHTLGRFITRAQEGLSFEVTARSATGQPLKRADITVALEVGGATAVTLKHTLRGAAAHTFTLTPAQLAALKAAAEQAPDAQDTWISARITVADERARRDELVRELRYVVSPAVAILEADKAQYGTGEVAQVIARVRDLDGAPMRGLALTLKGPNAEQRWQATTDEQGTARLRVPMPASDQQVQLYMEGVEAPIATQELSWAAARPMAAQVDEPILRERQQAKILVRFPENIRPVERVVHLDVVDTSGAIVQSALLKIEETPQGPVARGAFEAPSWGTMLVTLFALGKPAGAQPSGAMAHHQLGLLTEGQSLVVHPDKTLEILLDGVPDRASPGELLQIKPRVRTPQGKEVDASVGVALVDGRTLALRDPLEVTPMDQLYAPTLRTMSTTGAQILSWPVVSRNWGDGQQDIALPPFPFMEGGAVTPGEPRDGMAAMGDADGDDEEQEDGVIVGHGSGAAGMGVSSGSSALGGGVAKKKSIKLSEQMIEGKIQKPMVDMIGGSPDEPDAPVAARPAKARAQGAPQITIRTRFTDTSVWLPRARAGLGQPAFSAQMPDTISPQELLLVASDRDGGVGVARHTIQIEQALWVQADLPAVLRVGEAVDVPLMVANDGDVAREVTVSFEAPEAGAKLSVSKLTLAARERRVISARVAPTRAGAIPYKLAVSGGGAQDISEATLRVIPGGLSQRQTQRGVASAAGAAKLSWTTPAQGAQATLSVAMPSTAFAALDMRVLGAQLADDPLSVASDLSSAALLLRYTQRHDIQSPALRELRERVLGAVGQLRFAQGADGSFAYWRNGQAGAFITAWALEGLLEAQALDVAVPQDTILRAAEWLATRIEADGGFKVADIAFWEGDGAAVREGVGAEVFHVLTLLPASSRTPPVAQAIERLQARYMAYLKGERLEPLTTGRAIMALSRQGALDKELGKRALRGLLAARRDAHWEPSWFHAWGGMVELNAALLMAMQEVDPAGFAVELRDTLGWVLSTRATWGRWHHERDTAAGLRALLALGAQPAQAAGEVTVLLDGAPLRRVVLSAADPFMSALELAALELPPLAPGAHTLEVRSTSALAASVALALDTPLAPATRAASSGALKLSVSAPARGAAGADVVMVIKATRSDKAALPSALRIATSGLAELELVALARMLEGDVRVARARQDADALWIELAPQAAEVTFNLPMTLVRSGQGRWPAVSFTRGADAVAVSAGELVVEE